MSYKEKYFKFHGLEKCDILLCANCGKVAVNLHHIKYKSKGGSDEEENLIPLCYDCHASHHNKNTPTTEQIKKIKLTYIHDI